MRGSLRVKMACLTVVVVALIFAILLMAALTASSNQDPLRALLQPTAILWIAALTAYFSIAGWLLEKLINK